MLIERIKEAYSDFTSYFEPVGPITTVPTQRPAANTGTFSNTEMQARRHRRQRRMDRMGSRNSSGWAVRAW